MSKPVNFSRNPVAIHALTANHGNPNFKFEFLIKAYNHTAAEIAAVTLKGVPDAEGKFVLNAQQLLHAQLQPDLPAFNQAQILPGIYSLLQWTADISEFWGTSPLVKYGTTRVADNLVLMAGLSYLDFPGNNFITEHVAQGKKFLTWQPYQKLVSPGQQEFLYYLNVEQNLPTAYLHVKANHTDGTTTQLQPLSLANATDRLLIIPAGYDQLQLGTLAKKVSSYQVWISAAADSASTLNKSEERHYIVDYHYYKEPRYFLYQNSLGGFNTLRTTGETEEGTEVDIQEGERTVGDEYSPADSQYFSYGATFREKRKVNTGQLLYREELRHLREFFTSNYIYEIIGGRFVRIILEGSRHNLGKSSSSEYFAEFEYRYAHNEPAFSK